MAVWGNKAAVPSSVAPIAPIAPISFKEIIQQQSTAPDTFDPITEDYHIAEDIIDERLFLTTECSDDLKLAQLLQQLENEEASSSYDRNFSNENKKHPDQNIFSKISVVSRYDSSTSKQRHIYHESNVKSSDYKEAKYRENQLTSVGVDPTSQMFKGGVTMLPDGQFVSKHDSLLNSLSNSVKLSEIEGVGDLSGQGLLIGNSVANSIRSAAQNAERRRHK